MGNSTHKECVDSGFLMTRPVRTRITPRNVNSLKEGDHITWHRTYGIWHHANVVKTFSSGQIEVRHFASDRTGLKAKAIIQNKVVDPLKENGILYRINNSSIPGGNSAELVRDRKHFGFDGLLPLHHDRGSTNTTFENEKVFVRTRDVK
ncbi:hypothetical protein MAR_027880 [Mya arenaria]|uniref:LRAT domain-containing protein n=1 Tax=Mya arenaria TaxID=6604 RepID=A0ABY7DEP1_MYAAR|nr:hypothetical protein MAR_027880 [Mya arenaria]